MTALGFEGRVLLVLERPSDGATIEKSFRNLQMVKIAYARGIGTYDVLLADHVVLTAAALDVLTAAAPETDGAPAPETEAPAPEAEAGDDA
jgi:ribosomal protein L4